MIETRAVAGFFYTNPENTTIGGLDLCPSKRFSENLTIFLASPFRPATEPVASNSRWVRMAFPEVVAAQLVLQYLGDQHEITRSLLLPHEDPL